MELWVECEVWTGDLEALLPLVCVGGEELRPPRLAPPSLPTG